MNNDIYIPKDIAVRNVIHSIWQINYRTTFGNEYIIPKGVVEIIFNFSEGSAIDVNLSGKTSILPHCFINGFNRSPIELKLPRQQFFFGVLFQPSAIKKILRTPAREFSDITVDLTLIDPTFKILWHELAEQNDFSSRVTTFLGWLKKNLVVSHPRDQLLNNFLYAIDQHEISVKELASNMCYSPRQLSRKILESSGMNTEEMLLYKKYLQSVHLMHHSGQSLTAIAHQCGFTDQSHFIKTFKSFTNITPGEYKRNKSFVKGHLYRNVR